MQASHDTRHHGETTPPRVRPAARSALFIIAAGVTIGTPYLLMGPNFILDDWIWIRNRHFEGFLGTGNHPQLLARPVAWPIHLALFGLFSERPVVVYLVQWGINIGVALAFAGLLRRFLPEPLARAAAVIWLLLPQHSSSWHWASTANAGAASLLMLLGLRSLIDAHRARRRPTAAAILLGAAILCYEATAPPSLLAAALAAWSVRHSPELRTQRLAVVVALTGALAWVAALNPKGTQRGLFDFSLLPRVHFGFWTTGEPRIDLVIAAGLVLLLAWVLLRGTSDQRRLAIIGAGTIVVATGAWVTYRTAPFGIGDRANTQSSLGAAMVWTAAGATLRRRSLIVMAVLLFLGAALPPRVQSARDWAWAGDEALELASTPPVDGVAILGDCPEYRNHVAGLQGHWDASPAVQHHHDDPDLLAWFVRDSPIGIFNGGACRRDPFR
jgi:hypothetical protein